MEVRPGACCLHPGWDLTQCQGLPLCSHGPRGSKGPAAWGCPSKPLPCGAAALWFICLGAAHLIVGYHHQEGQMGVVTSHAGGFKVQTRFRAGKSHGLSDFQSVSHRLTRKHLYSPASLPPQAAGPVLQGSHGGVGRAG